VFEIGELDVLFDGIDDQIVRFQPPLTLLLTPALFAPTPLNSHCHMCLNGLLSMQVNTFIPV
jgi:hypothetical protein